MTTTLTVEITTRDETKPHICCMRDVKITVRDGLEGARLHNAVVEELKKIHGYGEWYSWRVKP